MLEPGFSFVDRRTVPGCHPPKGQMSLFHFVEPLLPPRHDLDVSTPVNIFFEVIEAFPHRHIDQDRAAKRSDARGVAILVLQSPDEARAVVCEGVDFRDLGDERCHRRMMKRSLHLRDVDLSELVLGHCVYFSRKIDAMSWGRVKDGVVEFCLVAAVSFGIVVASFYFSKAINSFNLVIACLVIPFVKTVLYASFDRKRVPEGSNRLLLVAFVTSVIGCTIGMFGLVFGLKPIGICLTTIGLITVSYGFLPLPRVATKTAEQH